MRLAVVAALGVSLLSFHGYFGLGLLMIPDFALYTQGGVGLFPSPLGRLLGAFGPAPFAVISSLAAGVVVFATALAARARGGSPVLAVLALVLTPATLYLTYAGVDGIALALLLLSLAGVFPYWTLPAAALTHLSLVPLTLLRLPRSLAARAALAVVAGCAVTSLTLTPYAGILTGLLDAGAPAAMLVGLGVGVGLSLPALLLAGRLPGVWVVALLVGVLECGLQHHLQARYLLPAAFIAATQVPSWEALRARQRACAVRLGLQPCLDVKPPANAQRPPLVTRAAARPNDRMSPGRVLPPA